MINVTSGFMNELHKDNCKFYLYLTITLYNGTVLHISNDKIWNGGFSIEDAVSSDDNFDVGAAIINKGTFLLNNIYDDFSQYDFTYATIVPEIGLMINNAVEKFKKGKFVVCEALYDDSVITLECYDNMYLLDKVVPQNFLSPPSTLGDIVDDIVDTFNLRLATVNFPHYNFIISKAPDTDNYTYRELLSWIAQICGCYARFDKNGDLELKWYDTEAFSEVESGLYGGVFDKNSNSVYTTGDNASGGSFNPWNTGYEHDAGAFDFERSRVHYISALHSHSIFVDDVVITGVQIIVKNPRNSGSSGGGPGSSDISGNGEATVIIDGDEAIEVLGDNYYELYDSEDYLIRIKYNPLITDDNADTILQWLFIQFRGFVFRKANLAIQPNPSIEAGDVAFIWDRKGNRYRIVVSRSDFTIGESQTIVSSAMNPVRNAINRYSQQEKNYVELAKMLENDKTAWETAVENLARDVENANGLYTTDVEDATTHAITHYLHNKQDLEESDIAIMISDVGITVTSNYDDPNPTWYGMEVNGDFIANKLYAHGIDADYVNTGHLRVRKTISGTLRTLFEVDMATGAFVINDNSGNAIFSVDANNRSLTIKPTTFTLTSSNETTIKGWAQDKASTAESNAKTYAEGKANTAESNAKSYVDGKGYQTATQVANAVSAGWTALTQSDVMTKLTNNGANQGIYLSGGNVYINASAINSGTISADRIGAKSITAEKISAIGGFTLAGSTVKRGHSSDGGHCYINSLYAQSVRSGVDEYGIPWNVQYEVGLKADMSEDDKVFYVRSGGAYRDADAVYWEPTATTSGYSSGFRAYINRAGEALFRQVSTGTIVGAPQTSAQGGGTGLVRVEVPSSGTSFDVYNGLNTVFSVTTSGSILMPYIGTGSGTSLVIDSSNYVRKNTSSKRYKNIIFPDVDITAFYSLTPKMAQYKLDVISKTDEWYGKTLPMLIAEEVDEICHEAAIHNADGTVEDWNARVLIPVHQQMLVEQHREIIALKAKIKELEGRLAPC